MSLLDPLPIGTLQAPNRVMFGPHETNLAWGRQLSERHQAYYQERAVGGCGIIVVEEVSVHSSDWPYERAPSIDDAAQGWTAIGAACHPNRSLVIAAIGHAGGQGSSAFSQRELWAPSDEPEVNSREVPKIMELEDIEAVVAGFERSARLATESGLDGVEVNAGQHSLIRQFLSGLTNRRDDGYGIDRTRFAVETLGAARAGLGPDQVLGLRLCADELAPWAGVTPDMAAEVADRLADLVDYLVVVRGSIFSVAESRPTGHHGTGFNLELAKMIRHGIGARIPVFAQGSIVDPQAAAEAVADEVCDGVEMTRALIADPRLVAKLEQGLHPRPCLLCNQRCRVRDNRNPIASGVAEPRSGAGAADQAEGSRSPSPAQVLVVGAGPAGLEAARVAAGRGHQVTVVESQTMAGGLLRTIAVMAGFERFALLADWLTEEAIRAGAMIELDRVADADLIERWPGPVLLATGGRPGPRSFETEAGAVVVDAKTVLVGERTRTTDTLIAGQRLPESVLVWDPVGDGVGVGVAELLAKTGRAITLCTPDPIAGTLLALSGDLAGANVRLQQAGVAIERRQRLVSVGASSVITIHTFTSTQTEIGVEAVIDCSSRLPDDSLSIDPATRPNVIRIGDGVAARTVAEAIREGRAAAQDLDRALVVNP
ncbi:MAG: mycofactocin system FadH/OYE family oxidoreductase 1 [Actinomycetia bacterium]|nr:mycofactocin system FadH/OYE family oxidoreductase 1 [Actinomycetes bacterium]